MALPPWGVYAAILSTRFPNSKPGKMYYEGLEAAPFPAHLHRTNLISSPMPPARAELGMPRRVVVLTDPEFASLECACQASVPFLLGGLDHSLPAQSEFSSLVRRQGRRPATPRNAIGPGVAVPRHLRPRKLRERTYPP